MKGQTSNIAILLFTHDSETEVKHKCFSINSDLYTNKFIAEKLIEATISTIKRSKIPYFVISTKNQFGESFGERLSNAIKCIYDKGFSKVIVTGNDTPNLSCKILCDVAELLNKNEIVIGPTNKGGTFLIGITKKAFNKQLFKTLPWQSKQLLRELINYTKFRSKNYFITKTLNDINTSGDLDEYIKRSTTKNKFFCFIVSLIARPSLDFSDVIAQNHLEIVRHLFGTPAPPVLIN